MSKNKGPVGGVHGREMPGSGDVDTIGPEKF